MSPESDGRGDEELRRLVRLTRETFADADLADDEAGLARLIEERQPAPPPRRARPVAIVGLAVVALGVAAGLVTWRFGRAPAPLTFEIVQGTGEPPAALRNTRIHFSDGSEIVLEDAARAEVRDLRAQGGRIVLVGGRARVFVVPRPEARWQVAAGPYLIDVSGTVFDLAWSDEDQALELWLRKGSVRLRGPLIGGGMVMTPGQHLLTRVRDNKIVLDSKPEPQEPEATPEANLLNPEPSPEPLPQPQATVPGTPQRQP